MQSKFIPFWGRGKRLALEDLLPGAEPPRRAPLPVASALLVGGLSSLVCGLGLLVGTLLPAGTGPIPDALAAASGAAHAAGLGVGALVLLGALLASWGDQMRRGQTQARELARVVEEQPDLRPALEGLAARQRHLQAGLGGLEQRLGGLHRELQQGLQGMLSGGLQGLELGLESRVARFEEQILERMDALQAGQPTEALWRLAASLDRLGADLARIVDERVGEHSARLREQLAEWTHAFNRELPRAEPAVATPPTAPAASEGRIAVQTAAEGIEAVARAAPSLAAELKQFRPGEDPAEGPREPMPARIEHPRARHPVADQENGEFDLDADQIDQDLSANLELLDQADPFASTARARLLGKGPKSGLERRPDPPAALPRPPSARAQSAPRPLHLDLGDER